MFAPGGRSLLPRPAAVAAFCATLVLAVFRAAPCVAAPGPQQDAPKGPEKPDWLAARPEAVKAWQDDRFGMFV